MAKQVAETAEDYPRVVVDFGDGYRVIECGAGIQWIVQKRIPRVGYPWQGQYFCRTKAALLHYSGHGEHPVLLGLPDRFPEGCHARGEAAEIRIDSGPLPHQPSEVESDVAYLAVSADGPP